MQPGGYLFAAGGSGGHVFPGLAVAEELLRREPNSRIRFVGSGREVESRALAGTGFEQTSLPSVSGSDLRRSPVRALRKLWSSIREARELLKRSSPQVVIGCGGFASWPLARAAKQLGFPLVLLEQNVLPGRTTRRLATRCDALCLAFEESRRYLPSRTPAIVTGNPVRRAIIDAASAGAREALAPLLLVLGGSLGAGGLNAAILSQLAAIREICAGWRIVHQAGIGDVEQVRSAYSAIGMNARVEAFVNDVASLLAAATVVVCRAGATTLAEVAVAGCAAIVVPWPQSKDDHQRLNAEWCASRGAALATSDQRPETVLAALKELTQSPDRRAQLSSRMKELARPDAARQIADVIARLAGHNPDPRH